MDERKYQCFARMKGMGTMVELDVECQERNRVENVKKVMMGLGSNI